MAVSASKFMGDHSFTRISTGKSTNISFSASTVAAGQATTTSNGDHNGDGNNKSSSTVAVSSSKSTGSHSLTTVSMRILLMNKQPARALRAPRPLLRPLLLLRPSCHPPALLKLWPPASTSLVHSLRSSWALRRWSKLPPVSTLRRSIAKGPAMSRPYAIGDSFFDGFLELRTLKRAEVCGGSVMDCMYT
jgi:hypothetical protein